MMCPVLPVVAVEKMIQKANLECKNLSPIQFDKCIKEKLVSIKNLVHNYNNYSNLTNLSDKICYDQCKNELKQNLKEEVARKCINECLRYNDLNLTTAFNLITKDFEKL